MEAMQREQETSSYQYMGQLTFIRDVKCWGNNVHGLGSEGTIGCLDNVVGLLSIVAPLEPSADGC